MTNFTGLLIWKKGMDIVKQVFNLVRLLPGGEQFSIRPQLIKSAVSIPSNITEGLGRGCRKDFKRFPDICLESYYDLETQVLIIQKNVFVNNFDFEKQFPLINKVEKMIPSFANKLTTNN